jgi:hypothetical protein
MTDLKLYEGSKDVSVTAATLFEVVKAVIASGKEAEFLKKAKDVNATLQASPPVVNLVKKFLHENKLHEGNAKLAHIVAPMAGAPSCF